ncbi:MAG: response regulator, partial [Bacteroidales bacterium]|nr:response regulator [Bacteroidales bacterium]
EKKWQHITQIPTDSRFVFAGVSGSFLPRAIITIPIMERNETVVVISISSIKEFDNQIINLINEIHEMLSSRMRGVLMHRKLNLLTERLQENYNLLEIQKKELETSSDLLQEQNTELEEQKRELSAQSRELTEQNTELEAQKNQLLEANKLKTSFLSNMSHELRTPLNSIISLSGVLERQLTGTISQEQEGFLEIINRNGKNLLELINDILDLSRIEAGQDYLELESFDINQLLGEVVELLKPLADQKGIDFGHANPDQSIWITTDIKKCKHIFYNIVGNAIKFTEKGKVEISVKVTNNQIAVQVSDTGIGIDPSHVENIFDEFRQADSSTSRRYGGTGLGLAIARKYAHMLKGSIQVETQPGRGSVFTVLLPHAYMQNPGKSYTITRNRIVENRTDEPETYAIEMAASGKSILLIEDSEPAVIQVKDALENHGFEVIVASGGKAALEILETTIPDGVILDLMMPEIDGFSVLQKIRETEHMALVPVLILTAKHVTKAELTFLKGNNIFQLIQKGDVDLPNLIDAVSRMVTPHKKKEDPILAISTLRHTPPMVLVAEDNKDNMLTIKALLGNGYQFVEAENGEQAVELAIEHTPDLILMDIALPGMSGLEAFSEIRSRKNLSHIPVIAVTANAMAGDRETILSHGFDAYLSKPIDEDVFIRLVNDLFGS